MGSNGQQQTDLDMKKAGLLITARGPGRTSRAECTVRRPGLATRGYRCVCLITVLEEAESGLRPSALEQPCVGADLHLHTARGVWVRRLDLANFLCLRAEGSDPEPGVLVQLLPSRVT